MHILAWVVELTLLVLSQLVQVSRVYNLVLRTVDAVAEPVSNNIESAALRTDLSVYNTSPLLPARTLYCTKRIGPTKEATILRCLLLHSDKSKAQWEENLIAWHPIKLKRSRAKVMPLPFVNIVKNDNG